MTRLLLHSSNGSLLVDTENGQVLPDESRYDGDDLRPIARVDLDEWRQTYREELPAMLDILDVGYWHRDVAGAEQYEPPAYDWRAEIRANP